MNIIKRVINRLNKDAARDRDQIQYYFDILECKKETVLLRGWIFSSKSAIQSLKIIFQSSREETYLPINMTKRVDVANAYGLKNIHCGFRLEAECISNRDVDMYLEYEMEGHCRRFFIGMVPANTERTVFQVKECKLLSYRGCINEFQTQTLSLPANIYKETVDIIVPVYNGYEYLDNLFAGIEKTEMKYRLFIVNDCSTDERVLPYLKTYAKDRNSVILLENEKNLGFVQSVNKALSQTKHHVAIVNTDVVVPEKWLERLMAPIILNSQVASSTPFTNSGTICSFPRFCENNHLFLNLPVQVIDQYFSALKPIYTKMPTGVGFCMGMGRKALDEVGLFDAETFYKGYGEENDWCQRALQKGYSHVHVENLFVWHKHGGSFASEDKQRYIERNLKLLEERYPSYHLDVAEYCAKDPNYQRREWVKLQIMFAVADEFVIVFSHNWGGGANTYLEDRVQEMLKQQNGVIQIIDDAELGLYVKVRYQDQKATFYVNNYDELYEAISELSCHAIIINELVSFENIEQAQHFILRLKETYKAKLTMLCHDFFAVCPSIYLMNDKQKHCFIPTSQECEECFRHNRNKMNTQAETIGQWRAIWEKFLLDCDEVITFSENTREYYRHYYPQVHYQVVPHKVDYIRPVDAYQKDTAQITIGVIGNLMPSKGAEIIYRMSDLIKEKGLNARIVVIGPDMDGNKNQDITIYGKYKREELPQLMKKYQVDVVFIASVWPETFSYTTEEAIQMGMKVAAFDLGAPGERLKKYEKSILIKEMTAEAALTAIMQNLDSEE